MERNEKGQYIKILTESGGRTCKKCGETKPIEEFSKRKFPSGNIGHRGECKKCKNIAISIRYYKNPFHKLEQSKKKYHSDIEKSRKRARDKYYRLNYKEKSLIYFYKHYDIVHETQRRSYIKLKDVISERRKIPRREEIKKLADVYIKNLIHERYGIKSEILKQHPEFIENYRQQIKVKRLLKQKKHENTETS